MSGDPVGYSGDVARDVKPGISRGLSEEEYVLFYLFHGVDGRNKKHLIEYSRFLTYFFTFFPCGLI